MLLIYQSEAGELEKIKTKPNRTKLNKKNGWIDKTGLSLPLCCSWRIASVYTSKQKIMRTSILDSLHLTNRLASFFVTILSLPFSLARDREGVLVQRAAIVDVDSNYLYASFSPFPFSFFRSFLFLFLFFFFLNFLCSLFIQWLSLNFVLDPICAGHVGRSPPIDKCNETGLRKGSSLGCINIHQRNSLGLNYGLDI